MSYSVQPQRWQSTMLPCPWDSPGKNTGAGCHFLLQCMKVKSERSCSVCLTPSDSIDCILPSSSIHGIFQARILEWGAIAFSVTSMLSECNCAVVWAFFGIAFLWDWNADLFQSCGNCWVFQIGWHIECNTFTASSFRIWNSSTGIPSPPLALLVVMLSKAHLTSHSRMSGSRWVSFVIFWV